MTLVTLVCPEGAADYPISHGTTSYRAFLADHLDPQSRWLVSVPPHVAVHLIHRGGFFVQTPTQTMLQHVLGSLEIAEVVATDKMPFNCSWGGISFVSHPRADGMHVAEVPLEAIPDLRAHGIDRAPPLESPKEERASRRRARAPEEGSKAEEQGTDTTGTKWPADPKGTPHPDVPQAPAD